MYCQVLVRKKGGGRSIERRTNDSKSAIKERKGRRLGVPYPWRGEVVPNQEGREWKNSPKGSFFSLGKGRKALQGGEGGETTRNPSRKERGGG